VTEGRKHLLDVLKEKVLEPERGRTRSHSVENSIWKRLQTCRKRQQNEWI